MPSPRTDQHPGNPYHPAWRLVGGVFFLVVGLLLLALACDDVVSPRTMHGGSGLPIRIILGVIFIGTAPIHFYRWRSERLEYRAARQHLCPRCNYDLRGLPANAPCPECGSAS